MRKTLAVLSLISVVGLGAGLDLRAQATAGRTIKVKVTAEQANLREKPDIGSGIVQQIPEGTVLDADRKEGEWFFVRYTLEDGGVIGGYIHESLVEVVGQGTAPAPTERAAPRTPSLDERIAAANRRDRGPVGAAGLELSVSAGAGWIAPRDLNDGARGFADYRSAFLGLPASDTIGSLHMVAAAGVELSYRASRWLAVGVGAEYVRGGNRSRVGFTDGTFSETLETRPLVSAIPVKFGVRFYPGRGFYIRGAAGVYFVTADYLYRLEQGEAWEEWKGAAKARRFGAETAFGGDWKVGERTSFFIEAGFRMASLTGFTGSGVYRDSALETLTEEGALYHIRMEGADSRVYPLLLVRASPPTEEGVVGSRQAELNLSGTSVRAGLRFRF
jgi:hypothetical protein